MTTQVSEFDDILLKSIDDAFLSMGETVKKSVYYHIKQQFNISKEDIPHNLPQFQMGLERIFGVGARFLEILIMKNLCAKIGYSLKLSKQEQLEFVKYVEAGKRVFMSDCSSVYSH